MKNVFLLLVFSFALSHNFFCQSNTNLEVTYVANEGFLISSGEQKIMFDALFKVEADWCISPSDSILENMTKAQEPFNDVDLILFSHHHVDHFSAPITIEYLKSNKTVKAVVTQQAVDLLKKESEFNSVINRVEEITPEQGTSTGYTCNGIEIKVLGTRHSPYFEENGTNRHEKVQQNGYLLKIGGKTILHLGDASIGFMRDIVDNFNLGKEKIDIMFYQCDARRESIDYIQNVIKPNVIVAMHLIPSRFEKIKKPLEIDYPNAFFFREPMEKRIFE